ncbi:GNAT family N-acetyltransferase [Kribbella sp. NPDC056951]|uniref:GNAT family N-acetyltransferase n=1 Tax=Kribbella sp. NPDC056951 TaxID=3345978 RepID=UPI0036368846
MTTPRLQLRLWREDEVDRITTARTNQATAHVLPFIPQPFAAEDARFWLRDLADQRTAGTRYNWCNLTLFRIENGTAELGYWLHPDAQGRGIIVEALERVTRWFFDEYGGRQLLIKTASTNRAARRTAERAGFRLLRTEPGQLQTGHRPRHPRHLRAVIIRRRTGRIGRQAVATAVGPGRPSGSVDLYVLSVGGSDQRVGLSPTVR